MALPPFGHVSLGPLAWTICCNKASKVQAAAKDESLCTVS